MREIKFRAERFGEIYDVLEWEFEAKQDILLQATDGYKLREHLKNITVMQYTGLKDKNGKEIFEGDVVKDLAKDEIFIVNFEQLQAPIFILGYNLHSGNNFIEVIGNIYENPELVGNK